MMVQRSQQIFFTTELAESAGLPVDRMPKTEQEFQKAEEAIQQALEKLSVQEREKATFDLHGIETTPAIPDDDPSIPVKLREMEMHLNKIPEKPAYDRAISINKDYIEDKAFRLMFLRSEDFDSELAADRLVLHMEKKQELFGNGEVLARTVKLTDLSHDDLEVVKSGTFQVGSSRDLAGRTIIRYVGKVKQYKDHDNLLRAMWYVTMRVLEDEEAQRKGLVYLAENYGGTGEKLNGLRRIRLIQQALPQRIQSGHYCFNNPVLWPAVAMLRLFAVALQHNRFRTHFGKPDDIAFDLQTFGIPVECCPQEHPDLTWHNEWLHIQQTLELEENCSDSNAVIIPRRFDVLFGKSKKAREHPGTVRCQYLVELMRDRYEQASRQEKTTVADQIMSGIKESGGRFLKFEKGLWVEVSHSVGREKISHWFRHMRSKTGTSSATEVVRVAGKRPSMTPSDCPSKRPGILLELEEDTKLPLHIASQF